MYIQRRCGSRWSHGNRLLRDRPKDVLVGDWTDVWEEDYITKTYTLPLYKKDNGGTCNRLQWYGRLVGGGTGHYDGWYLHMSERGMAFQYNKVYTASPAMMAVLHVQPGKYRIEVDASVEGNDGGADGNAYLYVTSDLTEGGGTVSHPTQHLLRDLDQETLRIPIGEHGKVSAELVLPENVNGIAVGITFRGRSQGHPEIRRLLLLRKISIWYLDSQENRIKLLLTNSEEVQQRKNRELEIRVTELCTQLQTRIETLQETNNNLVDIVRAKDTEIELVNKIVRDHQLKLEGLITIVMNIAQVTRVEIDSLPPPPPPQITAN